MSYIYDPNDRRGTNSQMQKAFLLIESIFTAPYGTYLSCDEKMEFATGKSMTNNDLFQVKENVNDGIIGFLKDMNAVLGDDAFSHEMNDEIGQGLLTTIFTEDVFIDKKLLDTFCVDDILNYRKDCKMFE